MVISVLGLFTIPSQFRFDRLTLLLTLFILLGSKSCADQGEAQKTGSFRKFRGAEAGTKQQHAQQRQAMACKYRHLRLLSKSNRWCCFLAAD
jgi:hypothetical protein